MKKSHVILSCYSRKGNAEPMFKSYGKYMENDYRNAQLINSFVDYTVSSRSYIEKTDSSWEAYKGHWELFSLAFVFHNVTFNYNDDNHSINIRMSCEDYTLAFFITFDI